MQPPTLGEVEEQKEVIGYLMEEGSRFLPVKQPGEDSQDPQMPPEMVGEASQEQQGARPSKAPRFIPQQPSDPPGIPVFSSTNYEEEDLFDAKGKTEVNGKTVLKPEEDPEAVINMETTAGDQAGGKSAREVEIIKCKQAFLNNIYNLVEGYAQHSVRMQETHIDHMEMTRVASTTLLCAWCALPLETAV